MRPLYGTADHLLTSEMLGLSVTWTSQDEIAQAIRLDTALELITPAVSLGSTDTLILPPAVLTHRVVDADTRAETGISGGLLRLSVGLEDARDLWSDLDRALDVVPKEARIHTEEMTLAAAR